MLRVFFCCFMLGFSSCAPRGDTSIQQQTVTPKEIRLQQARRTVNLNTLVGRGIIEFQWSDEDGKHRVQGDFDFWRSGCAISLRVSKGSEPLIWIGGDEQNHWMFDMLGDKKSLTINQEDVMFSNAKDMLVLLGLSPLPQGKIIVADGLVTVHSQERTWTASFDSLTHRPLDITLQHGIHRAFALHRSGIKVELLQKNRLLWPETGGLVDIESTTSNANVKIDFAWISTDTSEERMDRVFDLEFLRKAIRPSVVKGLLR